MNILLSNDDGYNAPGLQALRISLMQFATVITVAPETNRSGASNSLTLETPLRITDRGENIYSVNGTPTDCVHLALTGLLKDEPDIVISGINAGANMGDDVLYSGTVAAAMEGRFLGLPAIAVSSCSFGLEHVQSAVKTIELLFKQMSHFPDKEDTILNINVPNLPWNQIQGMQSTRLGRRHKAEPVINTKDPRGNDIYWVGPPGEEQDAGKGTDFYAINTQFISVTPIHIDLTRYQALQDTADWLENITL
ncbi:MAG: 5-nucleotidase SurE (EC [uncultured Thiotrichaceae bacterium]|uniref:5'-nucleotidase SurE n=1 Tax=uncultured Thiotrichaceae bacterium TaxID=298394 RepID=A0A6S6TUD2_9GAMM|nr:MAG: 5-nucleotidase SurE (EC [uncultured Thiotrichaceae bacterium]